MSHIVKIATKCKDQQAIIAACKRLKLAAPTQGKARIGGENCEGTLVQLPEWYQPVCINTTTGEVGYDNYNGHWGKQSHLDAFMQSYAVEKTKIEARKAGKHAIVQEQDDGSVKIIISSLGC